MDYGLRGRRALVTCPDDPVGAACVLALRSEGATVVESTDVDIVVARATALPELSLLDVDSAVPLHQAWNVVVDTVELYRNALAGMGERGWGRFVWIGAAASRSLDGDVPGPAEHDAIVTLAMRAAGKVLASEAGQFNITANSVIHGGEATPDDVAAAVTFLCSVGAGYITGVTITVDGGAGSAMF